MKTGVLLVNTGTPDAPTVPAVRRFLREFLSDPYVIDGHPLGRWLLVNLIILPLRPKRSAAAYRAIWRPEGSPLLFHGQCLRDSLASVLGDDYSVALGMRYGNPSLSAALADLREVERLVVLPLFPQYATATIGSVRARVEQLLAARESPPATAIIEPFFDDPGFIAALAVVHRQFLRAAAPDHLLFSFHGLPERQVRSSEGADVDCDRRAPCPPVGPDNQSCYRAQCFATARALAATLSLSDEQYSVGFQSRLGPAWIGPHTDHIILELRRRGVSKLAISSPSFVADNLETLEELGIRLRRDWLRAGGEAFALVPSLNAGAPWVEAVAAMVRRAGM